jgi:hypothetical protein
LTAAGIDVIYGIGIVIDKVVCFDLDFVFGLIEFCIIIIDVDGFD